MSEKYFAHSENDDGHGVRETVRNHTRRVTDLAVEFANAFGMAEQAQIAGLLHDLGKYSAQFQRRLTVRGEPSRDHWSIGAQLAVECYKERGLLPALAILGHHVGLETITTHIALVKNLAQALKEDSSGKRFTTNDRQSVGAAFQYDGFSFPKLDRYHTLSGDGEVPAAEMLDVRLLFSALVDADFLATEGHFSGDATTPYRPRKPGPSLDIDPAIAAFDDFLYIIRLQQNSPAAMQTVRDQLAADCLAAAELPQGAFTLSAPTGSGKTLSILAFALHHARKHGLRRIVLVMPFLNIIEQTVKIYRDIFAVDRGFDSQFVLEDHSLADEAKARDKPDGTEPAEIRRRLLAENWDAPLILTTNVQLLESLHANKPARCRKLHRLAKSVILFDEVQTLPPNLAKATLGTLSRLCQPDGPHGSTVVFATATQPAFSHLHAEVLKLSPAGWQPREIVSNSQRLFAAASGRVRVQWRHRKPLTFDSLVDELANRDRVLCIVNLKRHAAALATALRDRGIDGVLHLSTNLCSAHRLSVLERVRSRLKDPSQPVRLIATQCVEAGVDVSFPAVYRSLGPLEAIAQASGRCNRSGEGPTGDVIVFRWPDEPGRDARAQYPPGYAAAVNATETFLNGQNLDEDIIHSPRHIRAYYERLYQLAGRSDGTAGDEKKIDQALTMENFVEVAQEYRLIESDTINVIVPYDAEEYARLQAEASSDPPLKGEALREWYRRARRMTVSVYRPQPDSPIMMCLDPIRFGNQDLENRPELDTTWFWLLPVAKYDKLLGLTFPADASGVLIM